MILNKYFADIARKAIAVLPRFLREPILARHYVRTIQKSGLNAEPDLLVLPSLLRSDWVCVDIGANIGLYTKHLSALSKEVLAIEAVPFTFQVLSQMVKSLGLQNVRLYNFAVSDHNGRGAMNVPNIWKAYLSDGDEVDVSTVDALLADCPRVDFIKCDVEGHEIKVVNGSLETISRFKPAWLIETDWDSVLFARMYDLGYECYVGSGGRLILRKGARRTNYFFLHREA